jgi:hypothetical protein
VDHPFDDDDGGVPVQVQINTAKGVDVTTDWMEEEILDTLDRFGEQLTRVEVHLTDQNGDKPGTDDQRCVMEARVAGLKTVAVTHSAGNVHDAYGGALTKLSRSLDTTLAKVENRRGRDSIRHPEAPQLLPEEFIN